MIHRKRISLTGKEFDEVEISQLFQEIFPNLNFSKCFLSDWSHSRKQEFLLGRKTVLDLINKVGDFNPNLIRLEDGRCLWPKTLSGSISHTLNRVHHNFECIGIIGTDGELIGVDIESIDRFDQLDPRIFISDKEKNVLKESTHEKKILHSIIFSSKEAIYKAIFPIYLKFFGFNSAQLKTLTQLSNSSFKVEFILSKDIIKHSNFSTVEVISHLNKDFVVSELII